MSHASALNDLMAGLVERVKLLETVVVRECAVGSWVSVRPCAPEHGQRTFLGVYLGDLLKGANKLYNARSGEVEIVFARNPAIYVPELKQIVWGCDAFWGAIDADLGDAWYLRALQERGAAAATSAPPDCHAASAKDDCIEA